MKDVSEMKRMLCTFRLLPLRLNNLGKNVNEYKIDIFLHAIKSRLCSWPLFLSLTLYRLFFHHRHHHLFVKRPFLHAQLGLDVPPEMKPLHISLNTAIQHANQAPSYHPSHVHTKSSSLYPHTSPRHHHISTGRHPINLDNVNNIVIIGARNFIKCMIV